MRWPAAPPALLLPPLSLSLSLSVSIMLSTRTPMCAAMEHEPSSSCVCVNTQQGKAGQPVHHAVHQHTHVCSHSPAHTCTVHESTPSWTPAVTHSATLGRRCRGPLNTHGVPPRPWSTGRPAPCAAGHRTPEKEVPTCTSSTAVAKADTVTSLPAVSTRAALRHSSDTGMDKCAVLHSASTATSTVGMRCCCGGAGCVCATGSSVCVAQPVVQAHTWHCR